MPGQSVVAGEFGAIARLASSSTCAPPSRLTWRISPAESACWRAPPLSPTNDSERTMPARGIGAWLGLAKDRRGVSAVEFALILPFLLLLYLGGVELSQAVTADRKVTAATSAVGDLVAQASQVSNGDLENIFNAASAILAPYNAGALEIIVSSVAVDGDGARVLWSQGRNAAGYEPGSAIAVPAGLTTPDNTLIVAEAQYRYETTIGRIITDGVTLSEIYYLRPRAGDCVRHTAFGDSC